MQLVRFLVHYKVLLLPAAATEPERSATSAELPEGERMPKFTTISPTHIPGKKEYAWERFREGHYVAIGWLDDHGQRISNSIEA